MKAMAMSVRGMLLGVSEDKDYNTGTVIGVRIDLGVRDETGRFRQQSYKIRGAAVGQFTAYMDDVVTLKLTNVSINSYMAANRPAISIKADNAEIDE